MKFIDYFKRNKKTSVEQETKEDEIDIPNVKVIIEGIKLFDEEEKCIEESARELFKERFGSIEECAAFVGQDIRGLKFKTLKKDKDGTVEITFKSRELFSEDHIINENGTIIKSLGKPYKMSKEEYEKVMSNAWNEYVNEFASNNKEYIESIPIISADECSKQKLKRL